MTNKKTDKQDTKIKSAAAKLAATKAGQPADVKKSATTKPSAKTGAAETQKTVVKPTVKTAQWDDTSKSSTTKPTAAKPESAGTKKPSVEKPASKISGDAKKASDAKPTATKSDEKKPTSPKADAPTPTPTAKPTKSSPAKPEASEAMRLATQAMNHFITAKQEKSMAHFYHTIAKVWQDMTSVEKLNTAFSTIIADSSDWGFLKEIWPSLIKDGLSERGDWVVVGVYPTKPKKLIFDQIFVHENGEWKLAELKLYTAD